MNSKPPETNDPADEALPPSWLDALRTLPSEQGGPSCETNATVMATAHETLASIRRRRLRHYSWPALAAAACVIFALILLSQRNPKNPPQHAARSPEDKYAVILREVSAVFPHHVKAIVTDGGELRIALSDEPVAEGAQAVLIEACRDGSCTTVITYVGQTVEIGRQRVTVHAGENGDIVIEGPPQQSPGLHIKTRRI